jgi:DNA-binding winged helix-turn-helix (wHTH) protein/tetratricopeptide (TPR) repeat protein
MPHSNNLCYEFGPFKLNVAQRTLTRDGNVISLPPKATDILLVLLQNPGELVHKEYLMKEVWPDSFVEEGNLTQNIFTLRRALGDHRTDPQYIETVVRMGYRFIATVTSVDLGSLVPYPGQGQNIKAKIERTPILAVIPFINASEDDSLEYLADGFTDNIINCLSQISKLRVMSRSAVLRYKGEYLDPKAIANELNLDAMLMGKLVSRPTGLMLNTELVDATNGWLLWGDSFDFELKNILEIQEEITRQISTTLRLKVSREEVKRITTRYTENSQAYKAYIEGRFHWSRFTKDGIEAAIGHFRDAIELDQNYALAYAGIVDCYLRLSTNYLPPETESPNDEGVSSFELPLFLNLENSDKTFDVIPRVDLRHEWDWKVAERELRRANELRADYPAAYQWHTAYIHVRNLYQRLLENDFTQVGLSTSNYDVLTPRIPSGHLAPNEEVQVFCAIAREQVDVGNYQAASLVLSKWWHPGHWPKLSGLSAKSCADLLFTTGELAGFVASAEQAPIGQKNAESLLSGSIALFEQVGSPVRALEGRIELALCYYRQGNFDLGRTILVDVLSALSQNDNELRGLALIRLASLERHAGRLQDSLDRLKEAQSLAEDSGPWVTGRHHLELASTFKDLAVSEGNKSLFDRSLEHYWRALYQFEAIGNLRLLGIAENNLGFLLVTLGSFEQAHSHLAKARRIFERLGDKVRRAQVDDTLARLYLEECRFELAEQATNQAIETLRSGDEDPLLAEVLRTKGFAYCKLGRYAEAVRILEWAYGVAERCGDREGAGTALLIIVEETGSHLTSRELQDIGVRLRRLLSSSQQGGIRIRLRRALDVIQSLS